MQENIKYPRKYRDTINKKILEILRISEDASIFDAVHANAALETDKAQKELMRQFYACDPTPVVFNKVERDELWKLAKGKKTIADMDRLNSLCPALAHQIQKSYESGRNIQPAVFSEYAYAQTLANMLGLDIFVNCLENPDSLPTSAQELLNSHHLTPRYAYMAHEKPYMLIQAGGCNGIDSALINLSDLSIRTIEFKEPSAKTSEPDLPKYQEDGKLLVTDKFITKYPQFKAMLDEQEGLNFFELMGNNERNFSPESVTIAITNNYTNKHADVICTEDVQGVFVMLPADQLSVWANIEGEIRPAGKNPHAVWTPNALKKFLLEKGATINGSRVSFPVCELGLRKQRGSNGRVSGYKINSLFFVYKKDCRIDGDTARFSLDGVQQLNPTIAGKIFFTNLKYDDVKKRYNG